MSDPQPAPKLHWHHYLTRSLLSILCRLWFKLYGRWRVIGLENVPRSGKLLVAGNHASYLDPLMGWSAILPARHMWGVAKLELWTHPVAAYIMDSLGSIAVRRGAADRTMIRRVLELLEAGDAVGIYPEGTRTFDGELNLAQPGLGLLVHKSGAPVLPVAMLGAYEMLPRGAKRLTRARLTVAFGTPITFPPDYPREQIGADIMAAIAELMTKNGRPTAAPGPERGELLANRIAESPKGDA